VSADVYLPDAIEQHRLLAENVGVDLIPSDTNQKPVEISTADVDYAKKNFYDFLMVDTAVPLSIDEVIMKEIQALHTA
ncbi:signal recognition particle protein, partial [Neisseria sp. P0001.S009]